MKYQALYRKYRPKNFNEVAGQKVTMQILKNAIINDHISHAYLFYGPRGTGKTSIAKIFSRTINCLNPKDGIPCEECDNCINTKDNGCVDIIEIDAASNNGVEEIRELKNKISFVPSVLKYKVYIVDEVHMLSTGAFNALLKTLEEPPSHAIFILATTELNKVPLTIISRCQTLEFKKIDEQSMKNKLNEIAEKEDIKIDDTGLKEIAKYSNGGLRDAIGLLEKANSYTSDTITDNTIKEISGNISDEELEEFTSLFESKNIEDILTKINDYYNDGVDLIKLANNIVDYLRNKMIDSKNYNKDICSLIIELDKMISIMEKSENPKIVFEVTLINYLLDTKDDNENHKPATNVRVGNNDKQDNNRVEEKLIETNDVKPLDVDEKFKEIRVGNTLCNPQKNIISNIREKWSDLKDLAFDEEYGNIARLLSSDINPVAASNTNIIIVSKMKGLATQLNSDIITVEKIFKKVFGIDNKIVCLSQDEWKEYTLEFKNNKDKFKYQEETETKPSSKQSLKEKAKELFED